MKKLLTRGLLIVSVLLTLSIPVYACEHEMNDPDLPTRCSCGGGSGDQDAADAARREEEAEQLYALYVNYINGLNEWLIKD